MRASRPDRLIAALKNRQELNSIGIFQFCGPPASRPTTGRAHDRITLAPTAGASSSLRIVDADGKPATEIPGARIVPRIVGVWAARAAPELRIPTGRAPTITVDGSGRFGLVRPGRSILVENPGRPSRIGVSPAGSSFRYRAEGTQAGAAALTFGVEGGTVDYDGGEPPPE